METSWFHRKNRQRGNAPLIVLFVVAAALIGWLLWSSIGWTASWAAEKFPDEWERNLFGELGPQEGWKRNPSTPEQKMALEIFEHLKKTKGLRNLKYKLYFIEDKTPNAFAMPGGTIAVTSGLLELVKGKIGLAHVLGHEFGHIQERHSLAGMGHTLILGGLVMMLIGTDIGILGDAGLSLARSANSRDQETEADEYGLKLIFRSYGTTRGSAEFFEKLAANPEYRGNKFAAMLSTHPYTPDRLENLKEFASKLEKTKQTTKKKGRKDG